MAKKTTFRSILAWSVIVVAGVVLTEATLRLLSLNEGLYYRIFRNRVGRHTGLYEHDRTLGWRLRPGFEADVFYPHARVHERINSRGWRDEEWSVEKPEGVFRIAILGCSRTYGYGVSDDETFAAYLQERFNESGSDSAVEILNFGINGFGIGQMVLNYETYARDYAPDLVLIQTYSGGVFRTRLARAWGTAKPKFALVGDELVLESRPPETDPSKRLDTRLMKKSLIYRLVKNALLKREQIQVESTARAFFESDEARNLTRALLRRLKEQTKKDGASLLAFTWGAEADWFVETGASVGVETFSLDAMGERLDYRDGTRLIEKAFDDALNNPPPTGHWSPRGNQFVADAIFEHLKMRKAKAEPNVTSDSDDAG